MIDAFFAFFASGAGGNIRHAMGLTHLKSLSNSLFSVGANLAAKERFGSVVGSSFS